MIEQRKFRQALPLLERAVTINLAQRSEIYEDLAYTFANRAIAKRGLGDLTGASSDFVRAQRAAVVHHQRWFGLFEQARAFVKWSVCRFHAAARSGWLN